MLVSCAEFEEENFTRSRGERRVMTAVKSLDEITGEIVDAAYKLHTGRGPGLMESVYETIPERDLQRRGLRVERQKIVSFDYDGLPFNEGPKIDLLVEGTVVVEIKSVEQFSKAHAKQVLTYLRLLSLSVGLLINFGAPSLKDGLRRVVNGYESSASPRLRVNQTASKLAGA